MRSLLPREGRLALGDLNQVFFGNKSRLLVPRTEEWTSDREGGAREADGGREERDGSCGC